MKKIYLAPIIETLKIQSALIMQVQDPTLGDQAKNEPKIDPWNPNRRKPF